MSPWLAHNWTTTGRLLSIAGAKSLFLTNYDDLYSLGKALDLPTYLSWGVGNILGSKLEALWANLQTLVAVVGMVLLAPLAVIGFWRQRRAALFQGVMIYGVALYLAMSLAFTFPGAALPPSTRAAAVSWFPSAAANGRCAAFRTSTPCL